MAWYPKAVRRDIGRGRYRHTPVRMVCHTAVVNAGELKPKQSGSFWHFYIGPTGTVYQYVDTIYRAGAESGLGSVGSISVETWDGYREDASRRPIPLDAYGVTGWRSTSDVPAWTAGQVAALAELWAWLRATHPTIPNRLATTSRADTTSHGLAWHRLGVKRRAADSLSETGGVVWSADAGKVCPGARRIAQIPDIHAAANGTPQDPSGDRLPTSTDAYPGVVLGKDPKPGVTDRHPAVGRAQQALAARGLYSGAIDSVFGPAMHAAVTAFQTATGLRPVDGLIGPATWAALINQEDPMAQLTDAQLARLIAATDRILGAIPAGAARPDVRLLDSADGDYLREHIVDGVANLGDQLTTKLQEMEARAMDETLVPAIVATIDAIKGGTAAESIAEAVGSIVADQTAAAVGQLATRLDAAVAQLVQALHDALDGRDKDAAIEALRAVLEDTSFTLTPRDTEGAEA